MPWNLLMPMIAGGLSEYDVVISENTFPDSHILSHESYDLYEIVGSPVQPVHVTILVTEGANLGSLLISNSFHPSSTFAITLEDSGRIVGAGGRGGTGGHNELGPEVNYVGVDGKPGHPAIVSAFSFSLNADDGYVFGGGGGGGGGAAARDGGQNSAGGGGGGAGWNAAIGGSTLGISDSGQAFNGDPGSLTGGGTGGEGDGNPSGAGGDGGGWGGAGSAGEDAFQSDPGDGGTGGVAIEGTVAITVTLTGSIDHEDLETANRLLGGDTNVTFVDPE